MHAIRKHESNNRNVKNMENMQSLNHAKKSWQDHSRQTNTLFSLQRRDVTAVELIPPGRNDQAHFGVDNIAVLCTGFFPSTAVSIAGLQSQSNSIKANSVRFFPQGSQQAPCLGVHNLTNRSYIHSMFTHADSLRVFEKLARCQHSRIQTLALRFPQTNHQEACQVLSSFNWPIKRAARMDL